MHANGKEKKFRLQPVLANPLSSTTLSSEEHWQRQAIGQLLINARKRNNSFFLRRLSWKSPDWA